MACFALLCFVCAAIRYLSEYTLPENIVATTDLAEAVRGTHLMIHALPCQQTPEWLSKNKDLIPEDVLL